MKVCIEVRHSRKCREYCQYVCFKYKFENHLLANLITLNSANNNITKASS